jgi:hypothetical protein
MPPDWGLVWNAKRQPIRSRDRRKRIPASHPEPAAGRSGCGQPRRGDRTACRCLDAALGGGTALITALPLLGLMAGYRTLRDRDGLGLGDVKLAAVAGAWLGLPALFAAIELAALAAIGSHLVNAAIKRTPLRSTAFRPFGTFLTPALWLGWLAECLLG